MRVGRRKGLGAGASSGTTATMSGGRKQGASRCSVDEPAEGKAVYVIAWQPWGLQEKESLESAPA